jgi:hypothetical protein
VVREWENIVPSVEEIKEVLASASAGEGKQADASSGSSGGD